MEGKNIGSILAAQYDIALNGYEIGGGSIRNHQPDALKKVLQIMGHSDEDIEAQFGHMLDAFEYGAPPHGGIAPGLDRIIMILANEPNIREVIPIPKTGEPRPHDGCPVSAPAESSCGGEHPAEEIGRGIAIETGLAHRVPFFCSRLCICRHFAMMGPYVVPRPVSVFRVAAGR